ncbi:glycosyltransferase family 39 protein [Carboxylicivirga linearis]|uniref:Glycosyltransferase family 39 protein n=1 Tax=Carboxylicivirga linearis TaxID=1628157 RepID=A0ABS5JQ57_9BACT|nr:glycosyltransferase family 39 protein [Carboxylicivirga linearis]MBS2097008.1 glycosyltransferase family 39 protein [Carboxylicivirga linearis]
MKKQKEEQIDFIDKFENFCKTKSTIILTILLGLFSIMSLLLFNLRVSIGGDDSTYIMRAVNFLQEGTYPSFQGPVYPLFLSLFIGVFGIKIGVLKFTSFALMLISMYGFYKIFKDRIPYWMIFTTMLMLSVSSYFIFFSSQTYSEALFLALQILVFLVLFKDFDEENNFNWKRLLLLAGLIVAGYLTRTIGIGALIAVLVFYIINKNYKKVGGVLSGTVIIFLGFLLLKSLIWDAALMEGDQASTLIYKHPYDKSQGLETFGGYLMRFVDNSNLYLGKNLLKMTGLKDALSSSYNALATILLYALFIFGFLKTLKNNKYLLFSAIYVAVMLGITFVVLQRIWDQYRLIIPFFPFMLVLILYSFNQIAKIFKIKLLGYALVGLVVFSTFSSFVISFDKVDLMTLRKNVKGDKLLGYTDDWVNYLSMAKFIDENLPENAYVAVRKPNMARLYANGRKFYGIYRFDTQDPDKLLQMLKDKKVTHMVMASLRKNPAVYNKQTINTVQRYMYYIAQKYPQVFTVKHRIGEQEPAYLFEIHYDRLLTQEQLDARASQ